MCSPTRLPLAFIFSLRGGLRNIRRMNPPRPQDWKILGISVGTFLAIYGLVSVLDSPLKDLKKQSWIVSLIFNLISYSAILLPGYLVLKYVNRIQYLDVGGPKLLSPVIRLLFFGNSEESIDDSINGKCSLFFHNFIRLFFSFFSHRISESLQIRWIQISAGKENGHQTWNLCHRYYNSVADMELLARENHDQTVRWFNWSSWSIQGFSISSLCQSNHGLWSGLANDDFNQTAQTSSTDLQIFLLLNVEYFVQLVSIWSVEIHQFSNSNPSKSIKNNSRDDNDMDCLEVRFF